MESNWISVKDKLPENIGNYLCYTNDDLIVVCHISANCWWSLIPNARYYGDMGEKIVLKSKSTEREVTHWMPLPEPPKNN